ncbi:MULTISPECIES: hypothetical protein [unclassified Shewanella]|uniref:hypothetical protein n=1 Tax=unclassified Shewanella TaxID=196818 RepID=UPI001BBC4F87|nr:MULTISPECIES: hypothetical protein [unclassified Shewanella]GIU14706.1 hypothetical protein TUM4444_24820 [Shewanella sp. MBTL60-112-B1]GIU37755.1 hypothetical protein TUM4445_30730 [Shewanella sp. MBTL60-112-B2]
MKSMLNGIADSLNVQQRSPTVAPSVGVPQPANAPKHTKPSAIPTHRLESYSKWARVTQGQHRISAAQVAEQGLLQVQQLLKQLQSQVKQSLASNASEQTMLEQTARSKLIQHKLSQLAISYDSKPLVDHQLNLISAARPAARYSFSLKSVDLTAPKQRDERLIIQVGNQSTSLILPANKQPQQLLKNLNGSLKPLDIQATHNGEGKLIFTSPKSQWLQIQSGILMTGQGQRLPAGEPRTIKVNEELSWQDPREWRFGSNAELKQAIAKIAKSLHKVELQLQELSDSKQKILQQLQQVSLKKDGQLELESTMSQLSNLMQPTPFSLQVTSLMAQANMTRSQVSSLLS